MNSPLTPLPIIKKSFTTSLLGIMIRLYVPSIVVSIIYSLKASLLDFGLSHLKSLGLKRFNVGFNTRF